MNYGNSAKQKEKIKMNAKEIKEQEAKNALLELVKPGDTVYTVLRHVSRSGMYRAIDLFVLRDNQPVCLSYNASTLLEGWDKNHDACRASDCGMDMGFHLVYSLASILFQDGYALHQRWM
jgi:hypothetical protein